jgi:hypothetical protein
MKFYHFIVTIFLTTFQFVQAQTTEPISHEKLQGLLSLKANMEKKGDIRDNYTINIFTGNLKDAKKELKKFEGASHQLKADLVYEAPHFKIYAGSFNSRLAADRALVEIKKDYPNAVVLRP